MPGLFPSNPEEVMVIRNVTSDIITMSLPFARFGRLKIGGRGTLVKLPSGSLAVFSPVTLTSQIRDMIAQMGRVKYITALDMEHHIHLTSWKDAYPDAEIIAPEGLWEKRQSSAADKATGFTHIFRHDQPRPKISEEFDAEFETEYVYGHPSRELVFLHKRSRTLIEADLLFNLPAREQYSRIPGGATSGILAKIFNPLMSAEPPATWQKRFVWYVLSRGDRKAFTESMRRVDKWDFNRLIPCHGDIIESGAKGVFRTVMEWFHSVLLIDQNAMDAMRTSNDNRN